MSSNGNLPCSIKDVVDLVGIHVVRSTGTQLHCRCPFCNDLKAHLNVKLDKNVFRCNRCGKGGGVLHLYAAAHDVSLNVAYEELCRIFDYSKAIGSINGKETVSSGAMVIPEQSLADSGTRDNTYTNLLSLLSLGAAHRESLLLRGLSGADIVRLGYKTTPAVRSAKIVTELIDRGCDLCGVPGFYRDQESGVWKLDIRASGIMIPDRNSRGEIEAIQIRLDKTYKSKFNNLTSVGQYYGTAAACCPHFAGFREEADTVYLTEGVMKADIAHCLSAELGKSCAFVGLTGVGNINQYQRALTELKQYGVRRIKVAFDMDDLTNENVRAARERVLETGAAAGFDMTPLRWSPGCKGIDDLLLLIRERKRITGSISQQIK